MPEFAMSPPLLAPDAYHVPDAKWSSDYASTIPKYTGGGLIPVLIGEAIDKHVTSEQQKAFDTSQSASLPIVNERAKVPPLAAIEGAITTAVKTNAFLAQRMRDNSKIFLETKIIRFGLVRKNKEEEADPIMSAEILVKLTMRVGDGTSFQIGGYSGQSTTGVAMTALANEADQVQLLYREAADSLRDVVVAFLKRKYDE